MTIPSTGLKPSNSSSEYSRRVLAIVVMNEAEEHVVLQILKQSGMFSDPAPLGGTGAALHSFVFTCSDPDVGNVLWVLRTTGSGNLKIARLAQHLLDSDANYIGLIGIGCAGTTEKKLLGELLLTGSSFYVENGVVSSPAGGGEAVHIKLAKTRKDKESISDMGLQGHLKRSLKDGLKRSLKDEPIEDCFCSEKVILVDPDGADLCEKRETKDNAEVTYSRALYLLKTKVVEMESFGFISTLNTAIPARMAFIRVPTDRLSDKTEKSEKFGEKCDCLDAYAKDHKEASKCQIVILEKALRERLPKLVLDLLTGRPPNESIGAGMGNISKAGSNPVVDGIDVVSIIGSLENNPAYDWLYSVQSSKRRVPSVGEVHRGIEQLAALWEFPRERSSSSDVSESDDNLTRLVQKFFHYVTNSVRWLTIDVNADAVAVGIRRNCDLDDEKCDLDDEKFERLQRFLDACEKTVSVLNPRDSFMAGYIKQALTADGSGKWLSDDSYYGSSVSRFLMGPCSSPSTVRKGRANLVEMKNTGDIHMASALLAMVDVPGIRDQKALGKRSGGPRFYNGLLSLDHGEVPCFVRRFYLRAGAERINVFEVFITNDVFVKNVNSILVPSSCASCDKSSVVVVVSLGGVRSTEEMPRRVND